MQYRIVQNKITKRYKIQRKILWVWVFVYNTSTTSKEIISQWLNELIEEDNNSKRSNWVKIDD